jgi:hypothetical protein
MKKSLQLTLLLLSIILLSACSQKTPQVNSIIKDPTLLKQVPNKENVFYYLNKDFNANNYNQVIVPQIKIIVEEDDKKDIDEKLLNKISVYFQQNLQEELSSVLSKNNANNALIMKMSIVSFDVSYKALKPWQYLPYGLALKVVLRGSGLEKRKLNTTLAFQISDKKTKTPQIMVVDYKIRDDMPSYDELTFENVKPLLDYWIKNYKNRLEDFNNHKYKY